MSNRIVVMTDGRGAVFTQEQPIPRPGPGMILVRVRCSLISPGTELSGVAARRKNPDGDAAPRPFGYQNSGDILEIGPDCQDRFSVGQRVACMGNSHALHATHACVPQNLCFPIHERLSYEEAAFNHLAATALQAIRRAAPLLGENLLVMGLGLVGQLTARLGRMNGCHVVAADTLPGRLEAARQLDAGLAIDPRNEDFFHAVMDFTRGHAIDAGFICFGGEATKAVEQMVSVMKTAPDGHKMGRIVIVGGANLNMRFPTILGNIDLRPSSRTGPGYHDKAWERGADYPPVIVPWTTRRNVETVLRFMESGDLPVKPLITHRFPLEKAAEACEELLQRPDQALGVILRCG